MDKSRLSGSSIVCSCTYSCIIKNQGFLLLSVSKASEGKMQENMTQ